MISFRKKIPVENFLTSVSGLIPVLVAPKLKSATNAKLASFGIITTAAGKSRRCYISVRVVVCA
jgi:hypothetical protein